MGIELVQLQGLSAVAFDVDGVLTDGRLTWTTASDEEIKSFSFADIMGISLLRRLGIQLALISGEDSPLVTRYAEKMQIRTVIKGTRDKATALRAFTDERKVLISNTCFLGDDVNDLPAMEIAGMCACPANAGGGSAGACAGSRLREQAAWGARGRSGVCGCGVEGARLARA